MANPFNFALYSSTIQPSGTINYDKILNRCRIFDSSTYTVLSHDKHLDSIKYTFIESNSQMINNRIFKENINIFFPLNINKERA